MDISIYLYDTTEYFTTFLSFQIIIYLVEIRENFS